jgi:hypothetical protein
MRRLAMSVGFTLLGGFAALAQSPTIVYSKPGKPLKPTEIPVFKGAADSLISFDYRRADLRWVNRRWQVVAGDVLVKDFGPRQGEAREALQLIRGLRLTQHGTVGTPQPVVEFWLSDGRAPSVTMLGLHPTSFDRSTLRVDQIQGAWCVRDNQEVLFNFQNNQGTAQRTLAVIQRYGFDQVGYVGFGAPAMMYFLASGDLSHGRMAAQAQLVSRRHERPRDPNTALTSPFFKTTRPTAEDLSGLPLAPVGRLLSEQP